MRIFLALTLLLATSLESIDFEISDPEIRWATLDNGFSYLLLPSQKHSEVSAQLVVRAGALEERADESGYAHFLEHLVFRAAAGFPDGTFEHSLRSEACCLGLHVNAFTTHERTQYTLTADDGSHEAVDSVLRFLAAVLSDIRVDAGHVTRERPVIHCERQRDKDGTAMDTELMFATLFPDHPMGNCNVIGDGACVEAAEADGIQAFWERCYDPSAATLIVTGGFDVDDLEADVLSYFGNVAPRSRYRQPERTPPLPLPISVRVNPVGSEAILSIRTRNLPHAHGLDEMDPYYAALMCAAALDQRLKWLQYSELDGILDARCQLSAFELTHGYNLTLQLRGRADAWEEMLTAGITVLNATLSAPLTDDEITRARYRAQIGHLGMLNPRHAARPEQQCAWIAERTQCRQPLVDPYSAQQHCVDRIKDLDQADVLAVLDRIAGADKITIDLSLPGNVDVPSTEELAVLAQDAWSDCTPPLSVDWRTEIFLGLNRLFPSYAVTGDLSRPRLELPKVHQEPDGTTWIELSNGVCVHHTPSEDYRAQIVLAAGTVQERKPEQRGTTEAALQALQQSEAWPKLLIDQLGATMGAHLKVELDDVHLVYHVQAQSEAAFTVLLAIVEDCLLHPFLEESEFHTWQDAYARQMSKWTLEPEEQVFHRVTDALLADHEPRQRPVTADQVRALTLEKVFERAEKMAGCPIYVQMQSPLEAEAVGRLAASSFAEFNERRRAEQEDFRNDHKLRLAKTKSVVHLVEGAPQQQHAALVVGYHMPAKGQALGLLATRIAYSRAMELARYKDPLTYAITPRHEVSQAYANWGGIYLSSACPAANAERVAKLCGQVFQDLAERGPTSTEMESAKHIVRYELAENPAAPEDFDKVTAGRVQALFKKMINTGKFVEFIALPRVAL